jgi:AraC-like DNA-binding protein
MDNWNAIAYLLSFGQGAILSLSLIVKGINGRRASLFLGLVLLVLCQEVLNAWAMQIHYHSRPDAFPFWNFHSYLLLPISLWFFVRYVTVSGYVFKPKYLLVFLPIVVEVSLRSVWQAYWHASGGAVPSLLANPVWFFLTELLPIVGMVAVLAVYGSKLYEFHKNRRRQASALSLGQYPRFYGMFAFLTILTFLWIAGVIFKWPVFSGIEVFLALCLFGLGYIGYVDPEFFTLPTSPREKQAEKPDFTRFDDQTEFERLLDAFRRDGLHTQSGLTLEDVAGRLQMPGRYISYLINQYSNTNFNGFVNAFRVEEVIRKLADPKEQHKTILSLAFEAGFSSKSTFNQVFRQHTGKSPSQFLVVQK